MKTTTTTQTQTSPKKMGRPRKEKKGVYLWVPAVFSDSVIAYLQLLKQQQNAQDKR